MVDLGLMMHYYSGRFDEVGIGTQDIVGHAEPFHPVEGRWKSAQRAFVGALEGFDLLPQAPSTCPSPTQEYDSIVRR